MLLTCPDCHSGLEVPDGTTALVRCPACKAVFPPADGAPAGDAERSQPKTRRPVRSHEDEDDDRPRSRQRAPRRQRDEEDGRDGNRDFDPPDEGAETRRKRRRRSADEGLTPEERASRRHAFQRAAIGCKLIWLSFALFMLSMALILIFFFQSAFSEPIPELVVAAGVLGVLNWTSAVAGIGLCLSGPQVPGHWTYGGAATVATAVHLLLLLALVSQGREFGISKSDDSVVSVRWSMLPTRLNATMFYITAIVYPQNQGATPRTAMPLSMLTGVAEMVRAVLIMMMLSCLARAALDDELAHKCTRAAGIASAGPALMAVIIFTFVACMIETNAPVNRFTLTLFATVYMSVYAVVNAVILPCLLAAREVADACDEPFQSLIPQL